jgi:isoleucyl-tRNA synthetase
MKEVAAIIQDFNQAEINQLEKTGSLDKSGYNFIPDDVIISSEDIPGWSVANDGMVTVALDITLTDELKREGIARDFINRIQNLRKDKGLAVLDRIQIKLVNPEEAVLSALNTHASYICSETQADGLEYCTTLPDAVELDMDDFILKANIHVSKA